MRDFGDKRSSTWNQDKEAPAAGLAPSKRTLVEMLPASGPGMFPPASEPVQQKAESSAPTPAIPSGPRPTIHDLFGRVQRKAASAEPDTAAVHASAQRGIATSASPLPHAERIQQLFGRHDISGIKAHTGPEAGASASAMGAEAYATGNHVVLGAGTDLHTVAHEAAHVVQQRGGVQLKGGGVGEVGDRYEHHADAVADAVVQGKSAEGLLDAMAGGGGAGTGVQRKGGKGSKVKDTKVKDTPADVDGPDPEGSQDAIQSKLRQICELVRKQRDGDATHADAATASWYTQVDLNGLCAGWVEIHKNHAGWLEDLWGAVQSWTPPPAHTSSGAALDQLNKHIASQVEWCKSGRGAQECVLLLKSAWQAMDKVEAQSGYGKVPDSVHASELPMDQAPGGSRKADIQVTKKSAGRAVVEEIQAQIGTRNMDGFAQIYTDDHAMSVHIVRKAKTLILKVAETEKSGIVSCASWDDVMVVLQRGLYLRPDEPDSKKVSVQIFK